MADATIIDGKALAATIRAEVKAAVGALIARGGRPPGLAVVLVGHDPASEVYVRNKARQTIEAGMRSFEHKLPETASEQELLDLVADAQISNPRGRLVWRSLPYERRRETRSAVGGWLENSLVSPRPPNAASGLTM